MGQQNKIGSHKTAVCMDENGMTRVIYHQTCVIAFDRDRIILNSGGYRTLTTKTRINQASNQYMLGIRVSQKDYEWFVKYEGKEIPFSDNMEIRR